MNKLSFKTKDGGEVHLEDGCLDQHMISVTQLDENQDPYKATVHMSNSQAYDLALAILHNTVIKES